MKRKWFVLILIFVFFYSNSIFIQSYEIPDNITNIANTDISLDDKLQGGLKEYVSTGVFPEEGYQDQIIILSRSSEPLLSYLYPKAKVGGNYLHFLAKQSPDEVRELAMNNDIISIFPDFLMNQSLNEQPKSSSPTTDSFAAKEIMGLEDVWNDFNITGDGVTIGIIDSGVDFGVSDLESAAKMLPGGYTASLDATGSGIAIANMTFPSITSGSTKILEFSKSNLYGRIGETGQIISNNDLGIELEDLEITGISKPSISGKYKAGLIIQPGQTENINNQIFIFILTDSQISGVYDTLYIDFDTSLALSLAYAGYIFENGQRYLSLIDWSLNDEEPIDGSNPIANRDLDGDGIADVSAGSLATSLNLDFALYSQFYVRGIDPLGNVISLLYDSIGHGTLTAGSAVGRGIFSYPIFDDKTTEEVENGTLYKLPGSAPLAKIIATKGDAISLSYFIYGWFWTAGLELSSSGNFDVVNDDHIADITSNSWGDSIIGSEGEMKGMDIYSLLVDMMSVPELLYSGYPGMIFVVASGNGGSGYGTVARPGSSSMAITVGASSNYDFLNRTGRNDIASFSSRGPTPYGLIKPDVVAPGNTGYTLHTVIEGFGNGTFATGTFGGTSEATPRAAGVIALMYQALRQKNSDIDLGVVRTILKSTATDQGFHPTSQGAGLINAYDAIDSIFDGEQIIVSSISGSIIMGRRLQDAFQFNFGNEVDHPLLTDPIPDAFITALPQNISDGVVVDLLFGNGSSVDVNSLDMELLRMEQSGESNFQFSSISGEFTRINLESELPNNFRDANLLQISISLDEASWQASLENGVSSPNVILLDNARDRYVYDTFVQRSWVQQIYSGNPGSDFVGSPTLVFADEGYINEVPEWNGLHFQAYAQTFTYMPWNMNLSKLIGQISISGNIIDASQFASLRIGKQIVPIVLTSIDKVGFGDKAHSFPVDNSVKAPYMQDEAYGTLDWGYRPESGDFRFYQFELPDNATYFAIQMSWDVDNFIPDFYLYNNTGQLIKTTDTTYLGGGIYESTTSELNKQNLLVEVESNVYTLLVHFPQMPFSPKPVKFDLFTRYLVMDKIPIPQTIFSQDINFPVSDSLIISADNFSVASFPEIRIDSMDVEVTQGRNGSYSNIIPRVDFDTGTTRGVSDVEDLYFLELSAGEKVSLDLIWEGEYDADIYVIGPEGGELLVSDLLGGLGKTPGRDYESVKFAAKTDGVYIIYIDLILFPLSNILGSFEFKLNWESRIGPVLSSNTNSLELLSDFFANGDYDLFISYSSNFEISFQDEFKLSMENHIDFTSNLVSPTFNETLSDDITVEWSASTDVEADLSVITDGVERLLVIDYDSTSFTFNSNLFSNGKAIIRLKLSDGNFVHVHEVLIMIDNKFPSTLKSISTTEKSVPVLIPISIILPMIVLYSMIRRNNK